MDDLQKKGAEAMAFLFAIIVSILLVGFAIVSYFGGYNSTWTPRRIFLMHDEEKLIVKEIDTEESKRYFRLVPMELQEKK